SPGRRGRPPCLATARGALSGRLLLRRARSRWQCRGVQLRSAARAGCPRSPMSKKPAARDKNDILADAVLAGDRRALARAITTIESTRADHRAEAAALLDALLPAAGKSIRLGISGAPGVGKSTFIEAFGLHVIGEGHRVAVLAVDPSSKIGGGSILG